jgi:transposase
MKELKMKYSQELKEKVVSQMLAPTNKSVKALSKEFNVTTTTLYSWRQEAQTEGLIAPGNGQSSSKWSGHLKFSMLLESSRLSEAELGEYCRSKGIYLEQLKEWRTLCEVGLGSPVKVNNGLNGEEVKRIRVLEKELLRKERALAETAALLVLRKKAGAIWGEDEGV